MQLVVLSVLIAVALCDLTYKPSGWRPTGPAFTSHDNRLHSNIYGNKPALSYGTPEINPSIPSTPRNVDQTRTTMAPTTHRNREPTTPFNTNDDEGDLQNNPALAIANSFAFNKPVFVYNSFPIHPGFTFVK